MVAVAWFVPWFDSMSIGVLAQNPICVFCVDGNAGRGRVQRKVCCEFRVDHQWNEHRLLRPCGQDRLPQSMRVRWVAQ